MIKIFIAMHKPDDLVLLAPKEMYEPIHCGKALYIPNETKGFLPELNDNTGDNISVKNKMYSELTGLYWIWKNYKCDPNDIVGLSHYRRYFSEPNSDNMKFITKETIEKYLQECDFLTAGIGTEYDFTTPDMQSAYEVYCQCHNKKDMDNCLKAVKIVRPDIGNIIEDQIKHSACICLQNMFITKKKHLDEYCEFLFPVLDKTLEFTNLSDPYYQDYNGRFPGFLGERLLRPWLIATGHSAIGVGSLDWEKYSGYVWV